jgi:DNA-binding MarR family transcriptional regulator
MSTTRKPVTATAEATTGRGLAMALRAAYLAMHRLTDRALARHGVTADQFVVLSALAQGDARSQHELARRAASDPNTVRAMLVLLERRRLVTRTRQPTDKRVRATRLTAKGRRAHAALSTQIDPVRTKLLTALGSSATVTLLDLLNQVAQALEQAMP